MEKKKKVKSFTIRRSRWKRGGDKVNIATTSLLSSTGQMCCLGFYARACGFKKIEIDGKANLHDLLDQRMEHFRDLDPDLVHNEKDFIDVNDSPVIKGELRERHLRKLFAQRGVRVRFVD